MPAKHSFIVLVIDDTAETLNKIASRIEGDHAPGHLDPALPVEVRPVLIQLERSSGSPDSWGFSKESIQALFNACANPPDLILVDYGFADPALVKHLRAQAQTREIGADELEGKVLTAQDLARWCKSHGEPEARSRFKANLFDSARPVCLYSYASTEFLEALQGMDTRAKRIQSAFPRSRLVVIDARAELYDGNKFDSPGTSKHDPKFYAHLIALALDGVVHKEILRKLLQHARYLRVRRTAVSVATLAAIGSGIGLASHLAGGFATDLYSHGQRIGAFAVAVGMLFLLFLFGLAASLTFERVMERLLPGDSEHP